MKSKWKVLAVVAVVAVLLAAIGSGMAYFTTYASTQGQQPVNLGTEIEESITDWTKHVVIRSNPFSIPVYVRARAFTDGRFTLTYPQTAGWTANSDGYFYYDEILYASESTSELQVHIKLGDREINSITNKEELKNLGFNVVVVYECTRATDDNGNVIQPNWDQLIDLSGGEQ